MAAADNVVVELDTFVTVDIEEAKKEIKKHGLANLTNTVETKLEEWKDIPLNVGVTGSSGAGKSTLINTMRGLKAKDPGAAEVGIVETTSEPTPYMHPDNAKLKLWDLPGVGTPKFPKNAYLQQIGIERFDFFLIVSSERFSEEDLFLAKELEKINKRFIFVRSKVDNDLRNEEEDEPERSQKESMKIIRENIRDHLKDKKIQEKNRIVFLINCRTQQNLEFNLLVKFVIDNLPELKREVMVYSLRCFTQEMVRTKTELLRSRIWKAALLSGGAGAIPVPFASVPVDLAIYIYEMKFYMKQLGIDEDSLEKLAREYRVDVNYLRSKIVHMEFMIKRKINNDMVLSMIRGIGMAGLLLVADTLVDFVPIIGSILLGSITSFSATYFILSRILYLVAEDAENVLVAAIQEMEKKKAK